MRTADAPIGRTLIAVSEDLRTMTAIGMPRALVAAATAVAAILVACALTASVVPAGVLAAGAPLALRRLGPGGVASVAGGALALALLGAVLAGQAGDEAGLA